MIIAFAGQKGGAGKSTAAICVADEATVRGLKVLLVDADPQGTVRTWGEVAAEANRTPPPIVAMGATMHKPGQLDAVRGDGTDLVIIDCPPRHGDIQRSALMVSDLVVLACGPSAADAWALTGTIEAVEEAQIVRPSLEAVVLITRKQPRTAIGQRAREVLGRGSLKVLASELCMRVAYQEAIAAGQGASTYKTGDQAAADEVRALTDELLTRMPAPAARPLRKARGDRS